MQLLDSHPLFKRYLVLWQQLTQLNFTKKFRKQKLWAEMLVNIQDILNHVKLDVNGVTSINEKFATGGVHV